MFRANVTLLIRNIPVETEEEARKWLENFFFEESENSDGSYLLQNIMREGNENVDVDIFKEGEPR